MKKLILLIVMVLIMMVAVEGRLYGQSSQRQRMLDEPFRLLMGEDVPIDKRMLLDWGGWFRSSYVLLDETNGRGMNGFHAMRWQQLRLWSNINIDQVHQFYGRMKLDYLDWNHGTSFDRNDSDWDGANLERGWYNFRLSRAQWAYGWDPTKYDIAVRLGRQYVELGTGLALSIPLDAIVVDGYWGGWQLTGMGAQSIPSTYNIDRTFPDHKKESRHYWGVELRYNDWRDHEPFVYYFAQEDKDAGLIRGGQTFGYDSRYAGIGSRGRFFHRDLQYTCEIVGQWGKSFADDPGETNRQDIEAWAFDTELRYVVRDKKYTQLSVEYLLTSGDKDRLGSPTNTLGGNAPHTKDTSFSGWGYRQTGLTLAPRLSNLGMVRLGISSYPMNHISNFKRLKVGMDYYLYHKHQGEGAMSDSLSTKNHSYVGSEFDLYANWRVTSDLALQVYYGVFMPGSSFPDHEVWHFLFAGATLNF